MQSDELRHLCDAYFDPSASPGNGGLTFFLADYISDVRDWAKAALNFYNEKEQKNFYLEKVVKLNQVSEYSFLTFWARSDESDDPRLFRAVVDPLIGGIKVLLCEIKDGDEMPIPKYHVECFPCIPTREEDHPLAHGYWKSAGYQSVEVRDLSDLRDTCDIYMDPRKAQCGGGVTRFYADNSICVRGWAKAALNAYNEQKNFYLEKVVKLNKVSMYAYMTFWARSDESNERHLFRGVVNLIGGIKALLCEIKDGDEVIVPAEHEEYCPSTPISEEDHSPYYYPWFDLLSCSADGLVDAKRGLAVCEGYCKSAGYQSVEVLDLSDLRDTCDIYMDPRKAQCGGGVNGFMRIIPFVSGVRQKQP